VSFVHFGLLVWPLWQSRSEADFWALNRISPSSFPGKMEIKVEGSAWRGQARAMERVWPGELEQRGRVFSFSASEVPGIYHKWRDIASKRLRELPT